MNRQQTAQLGGIVADAIERRFPNGIRLDTIDLMKLRRELPPDLDIDDVVLRNLVANAGIQREDKIYVIRRDEFSSLATLLHSLVRQGHRLFFYEELLRKHSAELAEMKIFSSDVLAESLKSGKFNSEFARLSPACRFFKTKSFSIGNDVSIETEIRLCFHERHVLTYDEISSLLPYVPKDGIKTVLQHEKYVRVATGQYALPGNVIFDEDEVENALSIVRENFKKYQYMSLTSHFLRTPVRDCFERKCLQ